MSEALAYVAEKCAYECLRTDEAGRLYLLGLAGLHILSLRSWLERVDALADDGDYPAAIQVHRLSQGWPAKRRGTTRDSVGFGLLLGAAAAGRGGAGRRRRPRAPRRPPRLRPVPHPLPPMTGQEDEDVRLRWKGLVAEKVGSLLSSLAEEATGKGAPSSGPLYLLQEHYKALIPPIIGAVAEIGAWALLYDELWEDFQRDPVAKALFLECLEEPILESISALESFPIGISPTSWA